MRLLTAFMFTAALSLTACGGGSDDRLLSSLSDSDFIELCGDVDDGLSDAEIAGMVGLDCLQLGGYSDLADAQCADLETFSPETPAACATVMEKCPELFDDGGDA